MKRQAKREQKQRISAERLAELKTEAKLRDVEVTVLNPYPMHVRLKGRCTVDYWPATQRAWVFGSEHRANITSPAEAVAMALGESVGPDQLPEGAMDHLRSLQ